jgi:hypothetical protein
MSLLPDTEAHSNDGIRQQILLHALAFTVIDYSIPQVLPHHTQIFKAHWLLDELPVFT